MTNFEILNFHLDPSNKDLILDAFGRSLTIGDKAFYCDTCGYILQVTILGITKVVDSVNKPPSHFKVTLKLKVDTEPNAKPRHIKAYGKFWNITKPELIMV